MYDNYPPGVTGLEFEIAGPDYEQDEELECPAEDENGVPCGWKGIGTVVGYRKQYWWTCERCGREYEAYGKDW